jgi:maltooligosyltrehalose synthase
VAFARTHERQCAVVVAGRLFASLGPGVGTLPLVDAWGDTALDLSLVAPGTRIANVLTGERYAAAASGALPVAQAFAAFPGALLHFTTV